MKPIPEAIQSIMKLKNDIFNLKLNYKNEETLKQFTLCYEHLHDAAVSMCAANQIEENK